MNELVQQICSRTGISQDQAQTAVKTTVDFIKQRLPAPVSSQLDNMVSQGGGGNMPGMQQQAQQSMGDFGQSFGGTD
ncbi:MAG TPA: hypothetical protein VKB76_10745 [Ktedonobacterales bacterium]|nr:hypothetical protein [Ktedonobacterales bacterium]